MNKSSWRSGIFVAAVFLFAACIAVNKAMGQPVAEDAVQVKAGEVPEGDAYEVIDSFSWQGLEKGDLALAGAKGILPRLDRGEKPEIVKGADYYGVKFTGNMAAGYLLPSSCLKPDCRYTVEMDFCSDWTVERGPQGPMPPEGDKLANLFSMDGAPGQSRGNVISFFVAGPQVRLNWTPEIRSQGVDLRCALKIVKGEWFRFKTESSPAELKIWVNGELMMKGPSSGKMDWGENPPFFIGTAGVGTNGRVHYSADGIIRNFRLTVSRPKIDFELSFPLKITRPVEKKIYVRRGPATIIAFFPGPVGDEWKLKYLIKDFNDKIVFESQPQKITIPHTQLPLPDAGYGYFTVEVLALENGRTQATREECYVILSEAYPPGFEEESSFGIQNAGLPYYYHFFNNGAAAAPEPTWIRDLDGLYRDARVMSLAGAKWFRVWTLWNSIEYDKGVYRWDAYDAFVEILREYGFNIMMTVCATPKWASSEPPEAKSSSEYGGMTGSWTRWEPRDFSDVENIFYKLAERYKGEVDCFQVWNELDQAPGLDLDSVSWAGYYTEMVKAAHRGVKAANPNARINMGGFAALPMEKRKNNPKLMTAPELFAARPHDFYDIFDLHLYTVWNRKQRFDTTIYQIKPLQDFLKAQGVGHKPFWNSETAFMAGVPGSKANIFVVPNISLAEQAYRVQQMYTLSAGGGVEKTFYYLIHENDFGLLYWDGAPKPAYVAYATTARELRGYKFDKDMSESRGLRIIVFKNDKGREKAVVWAGEKERTLDLESTNGSKSIEVIDLMGNKKIMPAQNGICVLNLTESALFIPDFEKLTSSMMKVELPKMLIPGSRSSFQIHWNNPTGQKQVWELEMDAPGWDVEPGSIKVEVLPGKDKTVAFSLIGKGPASDSLELKIKRRRPGTNLAASETLYHVKTTKSVDISNGAKAEFSIDKTSQVVVGQQLVDLQNRITQELQWKGVKDLSVKGWVWREKDNLNIKVQVTDDALVNDNQDEEKLYNGDCVEIFLDLREPEKRFISPKSNGYYQILAPAPVRPELANKYHVFGGEMAGLDVKSVKTTEGYEVSVSVPLKLIKGKPDKVGFDIAVDDADAPGGRKTQLSWAGTSEGCIDPEKIGALIIEKTQ